MSNELTPQSELKKFVSVTSLICLFLIAIIDSLAAKFVDMISGNIAIATHVVTILLPFVCIYLIADKFAKVQGRTYSRLVELSNENTKIKESCESMIEDLYREKILPLTIVAAFYGDEIDNGIPTRTAGEKYVKPSEHLKVYIKGMMQQECRNLKTDAEINKIADSFIDYINLNK